MSVLGLAAAVLVAALARAQADPREDFEAAVAVLFPPEHSLFNRTSDYMQFIVDMEKLLDHNVVNEDTNSSSANLSSINTSFYTWLATDLRLPELNRAHQYNVDVYVADETGNTTVLNETKLVDTPFGHTSFSDITEENLKQFSVEKADVQLQQQEGACQKLDTMPADASVTTVPMFSWVSWECRYAWRQISNGLFWFWAWGKPTGWALAVLKSYYCEVAPVPMPRSTPAAAACDLVMNQGIPLRNLGADVPLASEALLNASVCSQATMKNYHGYDFGFPICLTAGSVDCTKRYAKWNHKCFVYSNANRALEVVAAYRYLRFGKTKAVVLTTWVGSNFWWYKGWNGKNTPATDTAEAEDGNPVSGKVLCDGQWGSLHAVVAIAGSIKWDSTYSLLVVSSWGEHWGNSGMFWLSAEAYEHCAVKGVGISFFADPQKAGLFSEVDESVKVDGARLAVPLKLVWTLLVLACVCVWLR